jgi:hypothetical protein
MSKNKRRLHPLELAAKNASFDLIGYIRNKYKEVLMKRATWNCQTTKQRIERIKRIDTNYERKEASISIRTHERTAGALLASPLCY